jgi:hypothetical protein
MSLNALNAVLIAICYNFSGKLLFFLFFLLLSLIQRSFPALGQ